MALLVSRLPDLIHPEETIIAAVIHDMFEDTPVTTSQMNEIAGERATMAAWRVTKKTPDAGERCTERLYEEMAQCPIASVVKGIDRSHNQRTMGGVFSFTKMNSYLDYTDEHILPMLKTARRRFPEQEAAYEIIKFVLTTQARLVRSLGAMAKAQ